MTVSRWEEEKKKKSSPKRATPKPRTTLTSTRSQIFKQPKVEATFALEKSSQHLGVRNIVVRAGRRIEFNFKSKPKATEVRLKITGLILRRSGSSVGDQRPDDRHTYNPQPVPKVFSKDLWADSFNVVTEGPAHEHVTLLKVEEQSFALAFLGEPVDQGYRCYHHYYIEVQTREEQEENWNTVSCMKFSVFSNYKPDLVSKVEIDPNSRVVNPRRPDWVDFEKVTTRIVDPVTQTWIDEEGKEDVEPESPLKVGKRCFGSSVEGPNKRPRVTTQLVEHRRSSTPPPVPPPDPIS